MKNTIILLCALLGLCTSKVRSQSLENDPLVHLLQDEAKYYVHKLGGEDLPAYYISFRVTDERNLLLQSDFGCSRVTPSSQKLLTTQVRVGSRQEDNYTYTTQALIPNMFAIGEAYTTQLPLFDNNTKAIKESLWKSVFKKYDAAVKTYKNGKNRQAIFGGDERNKIPSFSDHAKTVFYEAPYDDEQVKMDTARYVKLLDEATRIFRENSRLTKGMGILECNVVRQYFVNSEGTVVVQNRKSYRLVFEASAKASDGVECPLVIDFFTYDLNELPKKDSLLVVVRDLTKRVCNLADAPLTTADAGPILFSGEAAGVFFHEMLGHRLEGRRMESSNYNEVSKLIGTQILPKEFQVYDDPQVKYFGKQSLNGFYQYDEEGVRGERVACIKDGVLKQWLMSRMQTKEFVGSNGHGRAAKGMDPSPRQSNLFITTLHPYSEKQLREMLLQAAKKQGKAYGLYVRSVRKGQTYLGSSGNRNNALFVQPQEVYRVYVDGRPDELIRGVSVIGTPLSVLTQVQAAGGTEGVYTGFCGAESGFIPLSTISPMVLVTQMETQTKRALPVTALDSRTAMAHAERGDTGVIDFGQPQEVLAVMDSGLKTVVDTLGVKPFFMDAILMRSARSEVSSTCGSCLKLTDGAVDNQLAVHVLSGDSSVTSLSGESLTKNDKAQIAGRIDAIGLKEIILTQAKDRYTQSLRTLSAKRDKRKHSSQSEAAQTVLEFRPMQPGTKIGPSALENRVDMSVLTSLSNHLSTVLASYEGLFETNVTITAVNRDYYRVTSEGLKLRVPDASVVIRADAKVRDKDGNIYHRFGSWSAVGMASLPCADTLENKVRCFAAAVLLEGTAPTVDELYVGPVLYENQVASKMVREYVSDYLHSTRKFQSGQFDKKYRYINKRIVDSAVSVTQLGADTLSDGFRLPGYRANDADGCALQRVEVVKNGNLMRQLSGRYPSIGCSESTGNEMFVPRYGTTGYADGLLRIEASKTETYRGLYKKFLQRAKSAGLKYAYVVGAYPESEDLLLQVDTQTGQPRAVLGTFGKPEKGQMKAIQGIAKELQADFQYNWEGQWEGCIAPKAFLFDDVEMNVSKVTVDDTMPEQMYELRQH